MTQQKMLRRDPRTSRQLAAGGVDVPARPCRWAGVPDAGGALRHEFARTGALPDLEPALQAQPVRDRRPVEPVHVLLIPIFDCHMLLKILLSLFITS